MPVEQVAEMISTSCAMPRGSLAAPIRQLRASTVRPAAGPATAADRRKCPGVEEDVGGFEHRRLRRKAIGDLARKIALSFNSPNAMGLASYRMTPGSSMIAATVRDDRTTSGCSPERAKLVLRVELLGYTTSISRPRRQSG